jgi:hypothetical protein
MLRPVTVCQPARRIPLQKLIQVIIIELEADWGGGP